MTDIILRQTSWKPAATEEHAKVEFEIKTPLRSYQVFIAGDGLLQQPGLEAGVTLAVLAAMRTGNDLRVEGALSETFLKGVERYITVFTDAFPDYKPIKILPTGTYRADPADVSSKGRASFFSGGVDSFYTLFKGRDHITDIICLYGFDFRLDDAARRDAVGTMGRQVAEELGVRYRQVESNMGKVLEDFGSWGEHAHGLALIAVARMMAGTLGEVRIPGSFSSSEQKPWGSWSQTDPLFSDERLRVVHDACEAHRMDKIKRLATEPLFLQHVRVCWANIHGTYNCCQCEKCLRTMTTLKILGVLNKTPAFNLPLDVVKIAKIEFLRAGERIFPRENLQLLRESGKRMPELEKALTKQLRRPIWWSRLRLKWSKRLRKWRRIYRRIKTSTEAV